MLPRLILSPLDWYVPGGRSSIIVNLEVVYVRVLGSVCVRLLDVHDTYRIVVRGQ